nr:hypothetical protein OG781_36465 [Streptomyces sp. NBC_00830]
MTVCATHQGTVRGSLSPDGVVSFLGKGEAAIPSAGGTTSTSTELTGFLRRDNAL